MAKNVSYQTQLDGKSSGVVDSSAINNPEKSRFQRYNTFSENDYRFFATERYGDISPFYVCNGVPKDKNPLINSHELRTYTLSAPLMSDVYKHKNYFQVPMKAILPNTWDLIFTNPVQGDDVPSDAYSNCAILSYAQTAVANLSTAYGANRTTLTSGNISDWFTHFMHVVTYLESILSSGSLLTYLGFSGHAIFRTPAFYSYTSSFDAFFDEVIVPIIKSVPSFYFYRFGSSRYFTLDSFDNTATNRRRVSFRRFLEMFREDPTLVCRIDSSEDINTHIAELNTMLEDFGTKVSHLKQAMTYFNEPVDLSRLVAYQLVCAHFFSNDNVDYIYNADLFRKNASSLLYDHYVVNTSTSQVVLPYFDYNGVNITYDTFSNKNLSSVFSSVSSSCASMIPSNSDSEIKRRNARFSFISLILSYRKSLRNSDYFTGSRPRPLAIGNVNVPVTSNSVSAIDMTVSISKQRFLNAVNRFGASVDDYISGIFDSKLPPVDTDPKWLSNQSFKLFGTEIENTGEQQRDANSVTTIIKSNDGRYAFEAFCDVPSIYIGLTWYEMLRAYASANDRFFFHKDRFDMFNPYLQYVGDQAIFAHELSTSCESSNNFAYTTRYMEYKQRYDKAVGGFVCTPLRSWASIVSSDDESIASVGVNISPDFIRSSNVEFDKFYSSLTGYSLGTYFHFNVKYVNFNSITRAMDYTPTIL